MMNLENTTRSGVVRRRLAFSILVINRVATFPIVVGLIWRAVRFLLEDTFHLNYYYWPSINFSGLGWALGCAFAALANTVGIGCCNEVLADGRIREVLNPRFNAWHDSANAAARIGGLVLSLCCYLLIVVMQLFAVVGVNLGVGNLMMIVDFLHDHIRTYHYFEVLDSLVLGGVVAALICGIGTVVCSGYLVPKKVQTEGSDS